MNLPEKSVTDTQGGFWLYEILATVPGSVNRSDVCWQLSNRFLGVWLCCVAIAIAIILDVSATLD